MKRIEKLLLCALMVCALAMPAGLADEEAPAQEPSQVGTHTGAPAQEPEPVQTVETDDAFEQSGDGEAGAEPGKSPDAEASTAPSTLPGTEASTEPGTDASPAPSTSPDDATSPAPSQLPDDAASPAPSQLPDDATSPAPSTSPDDATSPAPSTSPDTEASPAPDETPAPSQPPLPGSVDGLVHIAPEGSAQQEDGIWRIQLSAPDAQLAFTWTVDAEATRYWVYVQSDGGDLHRLAETTQARIALVAADYMTGQHTLYVGASLADESVTWGCIPFALVGQMGGRPGGAFPGGGRPGSSMSQLPEQEQGFRVIPGEALTSKHASGTKDTAAYAGAALPASGERVTALRLDSTQTEIALDAGEEFYIFEAGGVLELTPESDGECWQLSALALRTLAESGIGRVVFHLGESAYALQTNMEFGGSIYATLRAAGYVSKDMVLRIDARGLRIEVAGNAYGVDGSGALLPDGE